MKRHGPLVAAGVLMVLTVLLLRAGGKNAVPAMGRRAMERRLEGLVELTQRPSPSSSPSPSPSPSPEPVAVETVEEAWDEVLRQTAPEPSPIRVEGAVSLELRNETDYDIDFTQLPALPEGLALDTKDPVVLIVHTHGSESYAQDSGQSNAVFRTQDETKSVIAVGETMAQTLEKRGYGVVHDKTLCDYPEYTGAYNRSRTVIQENLEQYPSLVLVLDVHRDAVENSDGTQMRMACTVGDTEMSQLMLVVGTDDGGLEHPSWRENLSLAAVLQARLSAQYPGMMRPVNLRTERFNQDLGALSLLVEVGASGNSLAEARESAACFADMLAAVLDDYCGKSS